MTDVLSRYYRALLAIRSEARENHPDPDKIFLLANEVLSFCPADHKPTIPPSHHEQDGRPEDDAIIMGKVIIALLYGRVLDAAALIATMQNPAPALEYLAEWKRRYAGAPYGPWDGGSPAGAGKSE